MKAALYSRVSTDMQNPSLQVAELCLYAAGRGFKVAREYQDVASGAKDRHPGLDRLMADARKGKFQAVMVWKCDRFTRITRHLLKALEEFRQLGIDFISVAEKIDTSAAGGKMVFSLVAAVAESDRSLVSERSRAALRGAAETGKTSGRPRCRVDLDEVRRLQAKGWSLKRIARKVYARCNGKSVHPSPALLCQRLKEEREKAQLAPPEGRAEPPDRGDHPEAGCAPAGDDGGPREE